MFLFSKTSQRLYSPPSHTLNGYRNYFLGKKSRRGVKSIFHLQPSVEVKNVLPLMASCRWQGQLYVFITFINRPTYQIIIKQDKPCTYTVILRYFGVTIVGVEKSNNAFCVCCWATCHCELHHNISASQQCFYGKFILPTYIKRWVSMYSARCCTDIKRTYVR